MKKSALILLVAVAISTVSCVDNAESPLVGALRSQQVEWMKAQTAQQVAKTAMETAAAAYTAASNALVLKTDEANYAALVARNADLLIEAKYKMALAKVKFDSDLADATALFAANGDKIALAHLKGYTDAVTSLETAISDRLTVQNDLVSAELLVAAHPADLASYLVGYQADIDAQKAKIVGYNAAIAIYQGIEDGRNVTSYENEKETLLQNNRTMLIRDIVILYDAQKNQDAIVVLENEDTRLSGLKTVANGDIADLEEELGNLDSTDSANDVRIAEIEAEIVTLKATVTKLTADIKAVDASITKLDAIDAAFEKEYVANGNLTEKNNLIITALNGVIGELDGANANLDPNLESGKTIAQLIEALEGNIDTADTEITRLVTASKVTSKEEAFTNAKKEIVLYTQKLATANAVVTAQEKIVAYWKGLLDKIFTA